MPRQHIAPRSAFANLVPSKVFWTTTTMLVENSPKHLERATLAMADSKIQRGCTWGLYKPLSQRQGSISQQHSTVRTPAINHCKSRLTMRGQGAAVVLHSLGKFAGKGTSAAAADVVAQMLGASRADQFLQIILQSRHSLGGACERLLVSSVQQLTLFAAP